MKLKHEKEQKNINILPSILIPFSSFFDKYKGMRLKTINDAITNVKNNKQQTAAVGVSAHIKFHQFLNKYAKRSITFF